MNQLEIINVGEENLEQFNQAESNNGMVIIGFFAPWCGACKMFKPTWHQTMEHIKSNQNLELGGIIATVSDSLMERIPYKSPDGFPTIRLYNKKKHIKDYKDERTFNHLLQFIKTHMKHKKKTKSRHTRHKQKGGRRKTHKRRRTRRKKKYQRTTKRKRRRRRRRRKRKRKHQ